jgi:glycosyltransferase involved in cell wall biosynthesis
LTIRSLVVARWSPWPPRSGAQLRSAQVVEALGSLGPVDLFLLADGRHETRLHVPDGLGVDHLGGAVRVERTETRAQRLLTFVPAAAPAQLRRQDDRIARERFRAVTARRGYDLAWFVRIESWHALGDLVEAATVVDYDDLRDRAAGARLPSWPGPDEKGSVLRRELRSARRRADARAWRRTQHRVAARVDRVVVCSEHDRRRVGVSNAAVVPNGVELHGPPVGRVAVSHPPTIVLQGSLAYGPNADAAERLVLDVLPRIRGEIPDACVRLAGRADASVERLALVDGVTVTGPVADIAGELARADLVAVPLREGAGTKIKVLEALAQRIPVVATSIATEGLAIEPGRHAEVADDPDGFAASCVRLLRDEHHRRALSDAGATLVAERYTAARAREAVVALATGARRVESSTRDAAAPPPA